ncbi:DUF2177 family protein [Bradyrhizobium sp.]|jgi:uncharacterized membrane protein|uniref:DUF2177 family protein n=1 Tax=Bradyrhizobium sp. TaxID=376 RepID=UPI003C198AA6
MLRYSIAYVVTGTVFLGADYVWLNRSIGFYRNSLGDLLADKPNLVAAAVLYLIYFAGIVVFTVMPAFRSDGWVSSLLLGGLLGLVAFATYDLTNLATLSRWPVIVTVVDMVWGTFVTALASLAGLVAIRTLAPI